MPNAPDHFVRRTRLVELLDDLASYPVTALVAPAGSGKTALVADWVHGCGLASAWLTLDESDRDPAQLCAALDLGRRDPRPERCRPGDGGRQQSRRADGRPASAHRGPRGGGGRRGGARRRRSPSRRRQPGRPVRARRVRREQAGRAAPGAARPTPPGPPDRSAARDREARRRHVRRLEVLRGGSAGDAGRPVPGHGARETSRQSPTWSGGWAAALQLAALAVRSQRAGQLEVHEDRNTFPAGSDRLVDSYLWHEVLRTERAELVELLLSTAVVDRMNYGLADALTGRSDAGDLLLEAEARGLFVTSFDPGGWFEVHGLVREMLLAELDRRSPEQLREQHARAAQWFESMDDGMAALGHWLDAGQPAEALRLLAATSMSLFESGRVAAIDRIIGRIPPQVAGADAASLVRFAWCRLLVDRTGFLDALAAAEAAVIQQGARDEAGRLGVLRAVSAWLSGDWQVCVDLALAGLAELGDHALADPIGRFGWSLVVRGVALGERWSDLGEIVERGRAAVTHDTDRRLAYEAARAVGLALSGQPIDCLQVAAGVRHMAELAEMGTLRVELDIAEAIAARELGDRDRAEPALEALAARSAYPNSYVRVLAMLELVEMRLGDGDLAGSGVAVPPGRGAGPARARRCRRSRAAGEDRGAALPRSGRPRRRPALDASNRRPVLAADLRGEGPSRCRAAAGRRRGRAPSRTALCPAPGRARAAAGPRGLGRRPRDGSQVRGDRCRPRGREGHAPDGRRRRGGRAGAHRAGRLAGARRLDGSAAARHAVRPGTRACADGARRGPDRSRA